MKTFKEHLSEHSGTFKRQWMDQDTMPSAAHAIEALNVFPSSKWKSALESLAIIAIQRTE